MSNAENGGMLVPEPAMTQMFPSGAFVDLLGPTSDVIHPDDIGHHLGMLCRYGGGVRRFYSVAEHASLVADLLAWQGYHAELVLAGLLHDAAEAYIGDVTSPLKYAMRVTEATKTGRFGERFRTDNGAWFVKPTRELRGVYSDISEGIDVAIGERFDIDPHLFDAKVVKTADMWALKIEAAELTYSRGAGWRWPGVLPNGGLLPDEVVWTGGLEPEVANLRWQARLDALVLS